MWSFFETGNWKLETGNLKLDAFGEIQNLTQSHPGTIRQNYGRQVYRSYGVNKAAKKFRGVFEAGQSGRENPETADRGDSIKILIIVEQGIADSMVS